MNNKTRYIFLRIAWMKYYQGVDEYDIPEGGGSFVAEHQYGGEVFNFYPIGKNYFGFSRVQDDKSIRIEALGADKDSESIDNIVIVFFAKNKLLGGGQYIVGWYKNAKLYRTAQEFKKSKVNYRNHFNSTARVEDCYLVPEEDRTVLPVPEDGPGQMNIWYVENYRDKKYIAEVKKYISDPENYIDRQPKGKKGTKRAWQQNAELKKKVEIAAMDAVHSYFTKRKFKVTDKSNENLGWDFEANLGSRTLLLEVKGLSGNLYSVDFTSNEYYHSKKNKKHYRICIVSNALNKQKQKVDIFYNEAGKWIDSEGWEIKPNEIVSARFEKVNSY